MKVKVRSIGNSLGIIFPKNITETMNFHVEEVIESDIDADKKN